MVIQDRVVETGLAQLITADESSLRLLWGPPGVMPRLAPEAKRSPGRFYALLLRAARADSLRREMNPIIFIYNNSKFLAPFIAKSASFISCG